MRDLSQKMSSAPLTLFRNLPGQITEEQLADYLRCRVGINIPVENISVRQSEHGDRASAIVVFDRESIADFFNRALQDMPLDGRRVYCAPPQPIMRKIFH
jgi:hypothetical protein